MRIGIDLGGTKIEGALISASGQIIEKKRTPTPREDYAATLTAIRELVLSLEGHAGMPCTVGIGIPGTICPDTGLVKNANSTWLNDQPFDQDLKTALGREVRMANDANCFALSEATDGAAAGAEIVFGVILGTGVGGGVVVHGRALTGLHQIAGEWGHNPLPRMTADESPGHLCFCGRRGCIETFLGGPAFSAAFKASDGRALEATEIAQAAAQGDKSAARALNAYIDRLARALGSVINILDPDIVVLGGGLSNIAALYRDLPGVLPKYVFTTKVRTKIVPPMHGDSSGVRGAAWLWPEV